MKNLFLRPREIGFLIFLFALAIRAVYYIRSGANPLLTYPVLDESYYIDLGTRISSGFWLGEERVFFMDPLYGYLLGLAFAVFGEGLESVRILQITLDAANGVLIFYLGKKVWSIRAGIAAGLIYAGYKVSFFYTLLILKTTVSITLLLLFVIFLLHTLHAERTGRWFLLGGCVAVLTYMQANLLTLAPLCVVLYWFHQKPRTSVILVHGACFLLGVSLFLAPGAVRNYRVSGEWVWMNSQSGRLLYSSNNPDNLTGRYNVPPFARPHPEDSETDFQKEAERRVGRPLSAKESSRYWTGKTWAFLKEHPREVLTLLWNKALGTVTNYEIPVNHSYGMYARLSGIDRWPLPTFALVFGMGIPGLALALMQRKEGAVLALPIVAVLITILLFYTSSRFRMPAVPFLILGAGIGVDRFLHWIGGKEILKPMGLLVASILLFTLSIYAPRPVGTGTEEFYLAKAYWSHGNFEKAREEASRAADTYPAQARFHVLLGMIALSQDRYDEAVRHNRRALEIDPGSADALHNWALALLMKGNGHEAVAAVERAISILPEGRYFFTLAKAKEALGEKDEAASLYREFLRRSRSSDPYRREAEERIGLLGQGGK
jgi:4-amino-4-deoxy-L-arabinose transferase-like glycosyltransferase